MTNKPVLFVAIAIAFVGGVFALLKPQPSAVSTASAPTHGPAATTTPGGPSGVSVVGNSAPDPARNVFDIVVQGGHRVSGPALLQVHQGEIVTLHVTSDTSDDLVLSGYETQPQVTAGATTTLILKANRIGRFTYELRKSGVALGVLEVAAR